MIFGHCIEKKVAGIQEKERNYTIWKEVTRIHAHMLVRNSKFAVTLYKAVLCHVSAHLLLSGKVRASSMGTALSQILNDANFRKKTEAMVLVVKVWTFCLNRTNLPMHLFVSLLQMEVFCHLGLYPLAHIACLYKVEQAAPEGVISVPCQAHWLRRVKRVLAAMKTLEHYAVDRQVATTVSDCKTSVNLQLWSRCFWWYSGTVQPTIYTWM